MVHAEAVEVQSLFGKAVYQRDNTLGPGGGTLLRVPFQPITSTIRDALRGLGFRCRYEERYWEAGPLESGAALEAQLRALLRDGELPGSPSKSRKHQRNGELHEAAAADDHQQQQQQQDEGGEEAVVEFHEGSAAHVVLRRAPDGVVTVEGPGLWNIRPMLQRILHFAEVDVSAGTAAAPGVGAPLPRWRSAWPLSGAEAAFVEAVLEHRKRSLRNPRHDEHEPIPPGVVVPPRFRPRSRDGLAMQGPFFCKNGLPHNIGRQFFAPVSKEINQILWADGTEPESDEAQERYNEWQLGELADREDWEEAVPQESQEGDWGDAGEEGVEEGFDS